MNAPPRTQAGNEAEVLRERGEATMGQTKDDLWRGISGMSATVTREEPLRVRAVRAICDAGSDGLTAWQVARRLDYTQPSRALYKALRAAEERGEVSVVRVDSTHFHNFRGGIMHGESKVYRPPMKQSSDLRDDDR